VGLVAVGAFLAASAFRRDAGADGGGGAAAGPDGTLIVELDDPATQVLVRRGGAVVQGPTTRRAFPLSPGGGVVEVLDWDGVGPLASEPFTLEPGGRAVVKVNMVQARLARPRLVLDPGGHTSVIRKVRFTPDGKYLITGSDDGTIRLWDVGDAKAKAGRMLPLLPGRFTGQFELSPDGRKLAAVCRYSVPDKTTFVVYVVGLPDGKVERVLRGGAAFLRALAFSPDGKRLAAGGDDKIVRVWSLEGGEPEQTLPAGDAVLGLAFSPDGGRLAQLLANRYVSPITDLRSGQVTQLVGVKVPPYWGMDPVAWSPDGRLVAACSPDGVRLWGPRGRLRLHLLRKVATGSVAFSADSRRLLVTLRMPDHRAAVFDVRTGKQLLLFAPRGPFPAAKVAQDGVLARDGNLAATVGGAAGVHAVYLWRATNGALVRRWAAPGSLAGADLRVGWAADGKTVAWRAFDDPASWNGPPVSFDLRELRFGPAPAVGEVRGAVGRQGSLLLKKVDNQTVQVLRDGNPVTDLKLPGVLRATLLGNDRAALSSADHRVYVFDTNTGKLVRNDLGHSGMPMVLAPSPDGRYLLTAADDQRLRVWDPGQRQALLLTLYVAGRDWVVWTPQGYYAASPGGERWLSWTVSRGLDRDRLSYPAGHYRRQFNRPDVVRRVLDRGSVWAAAVQAGVVPGKE
jgi:WD40 repeat protein